MSNKNVVALWGEAVNHSAIAYLLQHQDQYLSTDESLGLLKQRCATHLMNEHLATLSVALREAAKALAIVRHEGKAWIDTAQTDPCSVVVILEGGLEMVVSAEQIVQAVGSHFFQGQELTPCE